MESIITQKIEVSINKKDLISINQRSIICTWLYNYCLDFCKKESLNSINEPKCLIDRFYLNNMLVDLKLEFPFLKEVYSSVLKNVVYRLRKSLLSIPKSKRYNPSAYLDNNKNWFSLYYGGREKGYKIENQMLRISLSASKRIYVKLTQKIENKEPLNLRIIKQYGRYFALFQYKNKFPNLMKIENIKNWLAIDQNHENFFHAIDSYGHTYRFEKILQEEYFNKVLYKLYEKRERCSSLDKNGKVVINNNRKVRSLNRAIDRVSNKRHEQTITALGTIVKWISDRYDLVLIGDYLPTSESIPFDNMKLSMLHRTHIGKFRSMLDWKMKCKGKILRVINERNTSKVCCLCGNSEYRGPKEREFRCIKTGINVVRDLNSCVNIARRGGIEIKHPVVDKIMFKVIYDFKQNRLRKIN